MNLRYLQGRTWCQLGAILLAVLLTVAPALAHFPILTVDVGEKKLNQPVSATIRYGHPFENEFEDCPEPESIQVVAPDRKSTKVTPKKSTFELGGKNYAQWKFEFTPEVRGDYFVRVVWKTKPGKKDEPATQEIAETWVHVQQEKGWDQNVDGWSCLNRPYGILPGMVFRARLGELSGIHRMADVPFEFEHLNSAPPAALPKSTLITFTGKTDLNGELAISLPKAGWWALSAEVGHVPASGSLPPAAGPIKKHTLWLYVDQAQ